MSASTGALAREKTTIEGDERLVSGTTCSPGMIVGQRDQSARSASSAALARETTRVVNGSTDSSGSTNRQNIVPVLLPSVHRKDTGGVVVVSVFVKLSCAASGLEPASTTTNEPGVCGENTCVVRIEGR